MENNNQVINNPDYYRLPCGKYLEVFIWLKGLPFAVGSALKYAWRAGKKFGESRDKDLKKYHHYVNFLEEAVPSVGGTLWATRIESLYEEAEKWDGITEVKKIEWNLES